MEFDANSYLVEEISSDPERDPDGNQGFPAYDFDWSAGERDPLRAKASRSEKSPAKFLGKAGDFCLSFQRDAHRGWPQESGHHRYALVQTFMPEGMDP